MRGMNTGEFLEIITDDAKSYIANDACASIRRNNHMNDVKDSMIIDQRVVDAAIVDFINYMGVIRGVDYALYTKDLRSD